MSVVPALDLRPTDPDYQHAPGNIEAEQALLGAVLFDNAAYERVADYLRPEHFYEPFHGRLYAAMQEHIRKGQLAEPIVLMERFKRDPAFEELGGLRYLADLVDRAPPAANANDYGRIVRDTATRRGLMRLCGEIGAEAKDGTGEADELITAAESGLYALAEQGSTQEQLTFADYLTGAVEMAAEAYDRQGGIAGLETGLIDLDQKLGGLFKSHLLILAGRPSQGKTALATNIAFHVARRYAYEPLPDGGRRTISGGVVAFFSLEMSGEELALRILADVSGVSGDRIKKGQIDASEFGRIRDAAIEINSAPLHIDARGGLHIAQLCAKARRIKRSHGLDLIVVDYLQLATTDRRKDGNRVQEVSEITQALKALAKELDVPVLALSQLSRKVEEREDKRPQLSDLRESGSIEQDADVVMFVFREAYYLERAEPKPDTDAHVKWCEDMDRARSQAEVIIGKQRHGPIGTVRLSFDAELTKFGNLARPSFSASIEGARNPYGGGVE